MHLIVTWSIATTLMILSFGWKATLMTTSIQKDQVTSYSKNSTLTKMSIAKNKTDWIAMMRSIATWMIGWIHLIGWMPRIEKILNSMRLKPKTPRNPKIRNSTRLMRLMRSMLWTVLIKTTAMSRRMHRWNLMIHLAHCYLVSTAPMPHRAVSGVSVVTNSQCSRPILILSQASPTVPPTSTIS